MTNQEWQLVARPSGMPKPEDFKLADIAEPKEADLKDGEVLVDMKALSVDPYMRPRMNEGGAGYIPEFQLNVAMDGGAVAVVKASKAEKFPVGTVVTGMMKFRKSQIASAEGLQPIIPNVPETQFLGTLGLTGLSAFLPIKHIGQPKEGETAFVSGAAGAVGMCAVQILKLKGCKVYGCAGTDEKVAELKELGIEAFNYKGVENYTTKLKEVIPQGIDVYFDNVGGPTLEGVLNNMNRFGRIICCGAISQYNASGKDNYGVKNLFQIVTNSLKAEGFIVTQWISEFPAAVAELAGHVQKGEIKTRETVLEGFDKMPEAMIGLLSGKNTGKMVVKVA